MTTYSTFQINAARAALSDLMIKKAHRIAKDIGFSYEPAPDAPSDYPSLIKAAQVSLKVRVPLKVYDGASDQTIYTSAEANYAFRFWHDVCHFITPGADFTVAGEALAIAVQAKGVEQAFGKDSLEYKMFMADTLGQVTYFAIHGDFPQDQLAFCLASLQQF